ncbi:MAG: 23S rRNA (uracil(1939)-C(5))-methyltransferase RlmD [Elusimicrobiales bacterium]
MKTIELEFSKIVGEGKSLGRKDGKVVFSYGVLPGETAVIKVVKEKRNFIEGEVVEIKTESPYRQKPQENHFLSCSPWQIISYEKQVEFKRKLIEESLFQTVKENIKLDKFYSAPSLYGYRTKIEYSFGEFNGDMGLAFHKRGDYSTKIALNKGCALIDEKTNSLALNTLKFIKDSLIPINMLKTLIVRSSKRYDKKVAALFVKDENIRIKTDSRYNFLTVYSNPVASISQVDKILEKIGEDFVTERIINKDFDYGFDCFFQNNIELFESALTEIKNNITDSKRIIDLYCGVGVIGISLADTADEILLVESNKSSAEYAKKNIIKNGIKNASVFNLESEKLDFDFIKSSDTLVLDPPRAGLHNKVIKNIMKNLPRKIAYLSCNPITQGRDLNFLLEKYKINFVAGFDFYPNTPHMENLVLLEKK